MVIAQAVERLSERSSGAMGIATHWSGWASRRGLGSPTDSLPKTKWSALVIGMSKMVFEARAVMYQVLVGGLAAIDDS